MQYIKGVSVIAALLLSAGGALAVTKTFNGSVSNDVSVANNWTPAGVPTAADDVVIPAGTTASLLVNVADQTYRSLTVAGFFDIQSGQITLTTDGVTLQGGTIQMYRNNCCDSGGLRFSGGTQGVSGTGTILFPGGDGFLTFVFGCQGTIGTGVTVLGTVNAGNSISTDATSSVQLLGTVDMRAGSDLFISGALTNYNTAQNSLTGGTWLLRGGDINLPAGSNVLNVGASTTVSFGGGSFNGFGNIAANLGTLEFINGQDRTFVPGGSPGTFQNGGTIKLDSGSILTITGNFRTLGSSVIDLTMTGSDVNVQQSRIIVSGAAQLNNVGRLRVRYSGFLPPDCGETFTVLTHASRVAGFGTYESVPGETTANVLYNVASNTRVQVTGACGGQSTCDDIDFNNNGVFPEDQDVIDFFTVLAGGACQ